MDLIRNKKVTFNYEIEDTLEAGLVLHGFEVKSLRKKHGSLDGSYIIEENDALWLIGSYIPPYQPSNTPDSYGPYRKRKLLVKKGQIAEIAKKRKSSGLTVIPLKLYITRNIVKMSIALARGKKNHDKRQAIKKRDIERDIGRTLKN